MKQIIPSALLGALFAMGAVNAATTTPVGYYEFEGVVGGNLFVPSFVNAPAFSGVLTAATSTTLSVAANSLTAGAFNEGAIYATHYVEITSGPNAGTVVDIESNTASVITLAADASTLGLVGTETITVRPHLTLKGVFSAAQGLLPYTDNATFYSPDNTSQTYYYNADITGTGWSSDFDAIDGDSRPIPPGTGFVLGLAGDVSLTITGEVKSTNTVVQLAAGLPNIVGIVNPLVGDSTRIDATGFEGMTAYTDSITIYEAGPLLVSKTYYPLGDGTVSEDFMTPSDDVIQNTTGAFIIPAAEGTVTLKPGIP